MHVVLVKDGCAIAISNKRLEEMTEKQFAEKDELALANLLLTLDDLVLFNVESEIIVKGLWDKLKNIYEEKSLVNKIFLCR